MTKRLTHLQIKWLNIKLKRSYEGYDFQINLFKIYSDLPKMMAVMYSTSDFGEEEFEIKY